MDTTRTQNGIGGFRGLRRPGLLLSAVLVLCFGFGGAAFAYWTGSGTGAGAASSGTDRPLVITPGTPSAQLYPGGQAAVSLTISNPNPYPVEIDVLSLDEGQGTAGFGVDAQHAGCPLSTLTLTDQTNGGTGWTVPAKAGGVDGSLSVTLSNALQMSADAANACQGATFTVYLAAGGP